MIKDFPTKQQQLVDYVKKNLAKGYTSDALKYSLMSQGYGRTSVENAIKIAVKKLEKETPKITHTIFTEKNADMIVLDTKPETLFQKIKNIFKR